MKSMYVSQSPGTVAAKSVPACGDGPEPNHITRSFGRIPAKLLQDPELSDSDVRVYCVMALLERNGGKVTCGVRLMARACGKSKSYIHRGIKNLLKRGYVKITVGKSGQRGLYELTAAVFTEKRDGSAAKSRKGALRSCLKCGLPCVPNKNTGWCRPCIANAREDRRQAGMRDVELRKLLQERTSA